MIDAEQLAKERWGKLPKTFDLGRRSVLGTLLPDDFPAQQGNSPQSRIAFQQKVNEYFQINGYEEGKFPWEDD